MTTRLNLDSNVRQIGKSCEALLVNVGRLRIIGHDGCDDAGMTRTETPDVEISNLIAVNFETLTYRRHNILVRNRVEQNRTC